MKIVIWNGECYNDIKRCKKGGKENSRMERDEKNVVVNLRH